MFLPRKERETVQYTLACFEGDSTGLAFAGQECSSVSRGQGGLF